MDDFEHEPAPVPDIDFTPLAASSEAAATAAEPTPPSGPTCAIRLGGQPVIDEATEQLRETVEPWVAALLQADHVSLLLGSGLSNGLSHLCGVEAGSMQFTTEELAAYDEAAKRSATALGRTANIEDTIRVITQAVRHLHNTGEEEQAQTAQTVLDRTIASFAQQIATMEQGIGDKLGSGTAVDVDLILRRFFAAFVHRPATRERLHIFTTNYDRLVEHACDQLGVHVLDRFVGALTPRFHSSRLDLDLHYNPPGMRNEPRHAEGVVRFTKLHGSLDWRFAPGGVVERAPQALGQPIPTDASGIVIYPNDSKDLETTLYPYTDLFRDHAAAICRPNHVLVTYGYGFADSHINRAIADMLTIPSTHLLAISYDDPHGRIRLFLEDVGGTAQTSHVIGTEVASLDRIVDLLPSPAHDRVDIQRARVISKRAPAPDGSQQS